MRKGDVATDVPPVRCDVLVVGSGAGGLSAAVTAASLGLNVIVVEKEGVFGGTTAWSGGGCGFRATRSQSPPIIWRRRRLQPESSGSYSRATSAISRNARSAAR